MPLTIEMRIRDNVTVAMRVTQTDSFSLAFMAAKPPDNCHHGA
jgi:hypothetical protein